MYQLENKFRYVVTIPNGPSNILGYKFFYATLREIEIGDGGYMELQDYLSEDSSRKLIARDRYTGITNKGGDEIYQHDILKGNHTDHHVVVAICGGLSLMNVRYWGQENNELIASACNEAQNYSWIKAAVKIGDIYNNQVILKKALSKNDANI